MAAITSEREKKETHSFECPNCGATLVYGAGSQKLECDHCGGEHEVPDHYGPAEVQERELNELFQADAHRGLPTNRVLECEQCHACTTVAGQKTTGRCTFCGSELVSERDADDQLSPTALIPFKVTQEKAAGSFKSWIGSLWFRPSNLKKMAKMAQIEGVYTPFWTFDAQAHSRWRAESGKYYYERVKYRDNEGKMRTKQVRKTEWSPARGEREGFYDDLLVCASQGLDAQMVESLEPYHTEKELVPYQPEYLAGWSAEQYGLLPKDAWSRAREELENREYSASSSEVPGDTHRSLTVSTQLSEVTWKHVLLPVWIAAYQYNGKSYRFLVNGETGQVSGDAPFSFWKIFFLIMTLLLLFFSVIGTGGLSLIPIIGCGVVFGGVYLLVKGAQKLSSG